MHRTGDIYYILNICYKTVSDKGEEKKKIYILLE